MSKVRSIITKVIAILFFVLLIILFLIPFQNAQRNTNEQFLDEYRYEDATKTYFRTLHAAISNLDTIHSEIYHKTNKKKISLSVFNTLNDNIEFLKMEQVLTSMVNQELYELRQMPDPGSAGLVNAVNKSHETYIAYRDMLLSTEYDDEDYGENLLNARSELQKQKEKLRKLIYE